MQTKRITAGLSVSEQITVADVAALAEAGFNSIICNRPDGEGADQPVFAEIATAAHRHSIDHAVGAGGKRTRPAAA
jgi:sulfide:quinone oxidoreductase